jgi:predicted peptidase
MILAPKEPGHPYAATKHISFQYFDQTNSAAPFGYEYYVSLPPTYTTDTHRSWPLVLFLHGAGESQRSSNESYSTLRHGIPKIILCYDQWKQGADPPSISIPLAPRLRGRNPNKGKKGDADRSTEPVSPEVCQLVAENFITVTPSLNMEYGYGWNVSVLDALLDEVIQEYRIDTLRIHLTGFSMGGYGTWDLAMHSPSRFASLVPICGGGDHVRASIISYIPQWVHHGDRDDIIPLLQSRRMVDALKKHGANVKFTVHDDTGHDSWTDA